MLFNVNSYIPLAVIVLAGMSSVISAPIEGGLTERSEDLSLFLPREFFDVMEKRNLKDKVSGTGKKVNGTPGPRPITGLGLKESKDLVESTPVTIKPGVKLSSSQKNMLKKIG